MLAGGATDSGIPHVSYGTNPGTIDFDEDGLHEPSPALRSQLRTTLELLVYIKALLPLTLLPLLVLLVVYYPLLDTAVPAEVKALVFVLSLLGIVPCYIFAVECLEDIVIRQNSEKLGVVVNVIFEHLSEVLFAFFSLSWGKARALCWIKPMLLGCVLLNLLAGLGGAIVVAPLGDERIGSFGVSTWTTFSTGLVFSTAVFTFPSVYAWTISMTDAQVAVARKKLTLEEAQAHMSRNVLWVSRGLSLLVLTLYLSYLALVFHSNLNYYTSVGNPNAPSSLSYAAQYLSSLDGRPGSAVSGPRYGLTFALTCVAVAGTIQTGLCYLVVHTLSATSDVTGLPVPFLLVIVLPLVFEGGGLVASLLMSRAGRLDVAASISFSSIVHLYLCIVPTIILMAWVMSVPLDISLHPFLAATSFIAALLVAQLVVVNRVRWLEGSILLALYGLVCCVCLLGGWHLCYSAV